MQTDDGRPLNAMTINKGAPKRVSRRKAARLHAELKARMAAKLAASKARVDAYIFGDAEEPPEMGVSLRWDIGTGADRGCGTPRPAARGREW